MRSIANRHSLEKDADAGPDLGDLLNCTAILATGLADDSLCNVLVGQPYEENQDLWHKFINADLSAAKDHGEVAEMVPNRGIATFFPPGVVPIHQGLEYEIFKEALPARTAEHHVRGPVSPSKREHS